MFTALVCVVWFLIGLSMVTEVNRIKFLLLIFLISIGIFPKTTAMGIEEVTANPSKYYVWHKRNVSSRSVVLNMK